MAWKSRADCRKGFWTLDTYKQGGAVDHIPNPEPMRLCDTHCGCRHRIEVTRLPVQILAAVLPRTPWQFQVPLQALNRRSYAHARSCCKPCQRYMQCGCSHKVDKVPQHV